MSQPSPFYDDEEMNNETSPSHLVLRVYNYYRIFLSFCLLHIYVNVPDQQFVGQLHPALFQQLVYAYFLANIVIAVLCLVVPRKYVARRLPIFMIFCSDIIFFGLLMYSSGGINSILGNFLMVPVAFAGAMVLGRVAMAVAAIATMVCLYQEAYLHITLDRASTDNLVQAGILGITFFIVNILFQVLYKQLRTKDRQIVNLERVRELEQLTATTQRELEESNSRMQALLQSAGDGVLGLESDGRISFANPRAGALLDIDHELLNGRNIQDFFLPSEESPDDGIPLEAADAKQSVLAFIDVGGVHPEYDAQRWKSASDKLFYVEYSCESISSQGGAKNGVVVVFQDITERRDQDAKLHRLANFDTLTGLANRAHFQHFLDRAVARSDRSEQPMAVLFLDMDNFKYVNDTFGHEAGDILLQTAANRISGRVRSGDMVARLGGDEFAVALLDVAEESNAAAVAEGILEAVNEPIDLSGRDINGSLSIGIAVHGPSRRSGGGSDLLKCADAAMYSSKAKGGGCYHFFEPDMQEDAKNKRRIQKLLDSAVSNDEFTLLYQPIIKLADMSVKGAEALLRWTPTDAEPIPPDVFVPIAETSGQINEVGQWVVRQVCGELRAWYERYDTYPNVAINISTRQLRTGEFRSFFLEALQSHNIPPEQVELELTETGVIDDPKFVMAELTRIHDLGVKISIDDFGTGYSSLDYLRRLPLDYLKIDRSFTMDIGRSDSAEELIRVMIAIAHTLDLQVVAEGVETHAQLRFLEAHGCDHGQGYLFSRPGSLAEAAMIYVRDENELSSPESVIA
jgi:diguanylate cyclase (GGDEF)-like protein/PAS domain S-box-containing protein